MLRAGNINIRHLRAFGEVYRYRSVSAAAEIVHLSQPAITQAVAKLEAGLGVSLFQRTASGMTPLEPADLLMARVDRALDILATGEPGATRKRHTGQANASSFIASITSTQLRALVAISDYGNFSSAARALGVSQPAVHRVARDLEDIAGAIFYVRTPKRIELTSAASRLVRAAKLMLSELDQAIAEIAEWRGTDAAAIRVGALPLARSTFLPSAIARLQTVRPAMRVSVVEGQYSDLLQALISGDIDLIAGALRDPSPSTDIRQVELFSDRLGVFAGPSHPLSGVQSVSSEDLGRFPWVVPHKGTPTRSYFDTFACRTLNDARDAVIETSSMVLVRSLLQESHHLTMLSVNQMRFYAERGAVVRLPVNLGDTPRPIGLTTRTNWHPTKAQSQFLDLLDSASATFRADTGIQKVPSIMPAGVL